MYLTKILLSVSFLCLTDGWKKPETQYALITPVQLKGGQHEMMVLHLQGHEEPLNYTAVLQVNGENHTIMEGTAEPNSHYESKSFTVPTMNETTPVNLILTATGENTEIMQSSVVAITPIIPYITYVQTSKPVYQPGETVHGSVFSLNLLGMPLVMSYPSISINDPNGISLMTWLNVPREIFIDIQADLDFDAQTGQYSVVVRNGEDLIIQTNFEVAPIELPRLFMTVNTPSTLSVMERTMMIGVSVSYIYEEAVPGSVLIRCCRPLAYLYGTRANCYKGKEDICTDIIGQLDAYGNYQTHIDLDQFSKGGSEYQMALTLDIVMTEDGSGEQSREYRYVSITAALANVYLRDPKEHYKPGMPFILEAVLINEKNEPMANEILELEVNGRKDQWPVTDKDGVAVFIISTTDTYTPNITMRVSYNNPDQCYYSPWNDYYDGPYAEHIAHRFYSKTGSFLDIQQTKGPLSCGKTHDIEVRYLLGSNGAEKATFYYQLISRKSIVLADKQEVDVAPSRLGSFNLGLPTIPLLHPYSYLLVYTFHEGETVVDTMVLNIEGCLNNQVTIGFSEEEAAPGDEVDLMFTATSESLCLLRVLDARVDNEYPYNILTPEQILYSFPTGNSYRYHVGDLDLEDPAPPCEDPQEQIFCQGGYYTQVSYWREGDAYGKLKDLGLKWITRLSYKNPEVCGMEEEEIYHYHDGVMLKNAAASGAVGSPSPASIVTVRDNFTDTLLYSVFSTDSEGNGRVSLTLPGSITKWDGSTVCLSNLEGIGITKEKAMLSSTLPYFVDITSSSMVINGETMTLRVSVSNFLGKCVKSVITLASSSHYEAVLSSGELEQCVCSGDKAHVTYSITFMEAGAFNISVTAETTQISDTCVGPNDESQPSRRDTKIWIIFVEPEGIKTEVTTSQFICVQDTNSESQTSLTIAGDFVSGSETGHVTITPDVFGLVLSNIDDLLDMPYSCAEQNIARIQFILTVLNYLKCRNQLTDEKYKELQKKLSEGYGRQVGFYLHDGSYGVFRNSAPNTWVTVKTIKVFIEAKKHIFIDSKLVPQALIWLKNQQDPQTGCFRRSGYIFRTQNDAEDNILLTIYTGISLMRSEDSLAQSILEGVKNCLRPLKIDDLSIYTTGYLFVFSALDENWDLWQVIYDHIIPLAIEEGPGHCWEFNNRADVETTSLMLYGLSMAPEIAEDQKAYLATISAWIISKMNSRGGFSTTQDTEMAIQALSALACRIGIPNTGYTVFIRKSGEELYKLDFNNQNWLQVPNYQLPDIPEDYTTEVMGSGCCLVQYTAKYNVPVSEENSAFSLSVYSSPESCNNGVAYSYMIHISVSYIGEVEPCTMAIVEVKLQSGYDLTYHSLHELESLTGVSKAEKKGNVVIVYLENVTSVSVLISFKVNMGNRVSNLQDAIVRAYSYYNKEKNAAASYSHPCKGQAKGD